MKSLIKYLTTIVMIKHSGTKDTINIKYEKNAIKILATANEYHHSWKPVTRLQKWLGAY